MISAALALNFNVTPDALAEGSPATAGLTAFESMLLNITEGDTQFHRVLRPDNVDHDYSGTLTTDSFYYGTFPGLKNKAGGGAVAIPDWEGQPYQFTTLRLLLIRIQPIVAYEPAFAGTTLNSNATTPTTGDPVTIGSKTYTFKTTLSAGPAVEGEVLINGSAAAALLNLARAINLTGTPGTDYTAAAAHPEVSAAASVTTVSASLLQLPLTALVGGESGNLLASSTTATTLSFPGVTLSGGATTATPLIAKPFGGTVTLHLLDGLIPGGSSADANPTYSKPGFYIHAVDGGWSPAAAATLGVQWATTTAATIADINAVVTLLMVGDAA